MLTSRAQYALVDKNGLAPVVRSHQDDQRDPLVCDSIKGLLTMAGDWSDYGTAGFIAQLVPGGEFADLIVVREEVQVHLLHPDEAAQLEQLKQYMASADADDAGEDPGDDEDLD